VAGRPNTLVLAGSGNNGGDGYVIARLAHQAGLDVGVYPAASPEVLSGDARTAYKQYHGPVGRQLSSPGSFRRCGNSGRCPAGRRSQPRSGRLLCRADPGDASLQGSNFSIDIPSGLHADTGWVMGEAVKAAATLSFLGLKTGTLYRRRTGTLRRRFFYSDLDVHGPPPNVSPPQPGCCRHWHRDSPSPSCPQGPLRTCTGGGRRSGL
jgi:NAD(P)H-hydrate epimerase